MDTVGRGDAAGEKWWATLRSRAASLTETARRGAFHRHGAATGEGAR
ncbi:DUF6380 family protein [Streptomyces sp. NPDC058751]